MKGEPLYTPHVSEVRMSDTGFWVVGVSISPSRTLRTMLGGVGITREEAEQVALDLLPYTGVPYLETTGVRPPIPGRHTYPQTQGEL